jgi:hypothetical protein
LCLCVFVVLFSFFLMVKSQPTHLVVGVEQNVLCLRSNNVYIPQKKNTQGHERDKVFILLRGEKESRDLDQWATLSVRCQKPLEDMHTLSRWPDCPVVEPDHGFGLSMVCLKVLSHEGNATACVCGDLETCGTSVWFGKAVAAQSNPLCPAPLLCFSSIQKLHFGRPSNTELSRFEKRGTSKLSEKCQAGTQRSAFFRHSAAAPVGRGSFAFYELTISMILSMTSFTLLEKAHTKIWIRGLNHKDTKSTKAWKW